MLEDTPDDSDIPYLIADNYNGMRQCIEHLVNIHGYRKIAFVAGPANNKDSNERLARRPLTTQRERDLTSLGKVDVCVENDMRIVPEQETTALIR